jgi:hypothetical protein
LLRIERRVVSSIPIVRPHGHAGEVVRDDVPGVRGGKNGRETDKRHNQENASQKAIVGDC